MFNFLLFTIFYFVCIYSVIGYGLIFKKLFLNESYKNDYDYLGFYGIFILIIYSYISHFFLPHNLYHNVILLTIGIIFFLKNFKDLLKKKYLSTLNIIFLIFFVSFFIYKTHDDFPYYHFPYTYYLTQNSMMIGLGQFNHGFRTPSSLFYFNSLFYLPLIKYYMFNFLPILVMGFANLIFIKKIFNYFDQKKIDYIFYLNLFFLLFINIFFYRIQEHGTDKSAQILILVLFIEMIVLAKFFKNYEKNIDNIIILLGIIISLKSFYFLYLIFCLPFLIILYSFKKMFIIKRIIINKLFILFLIFLIVLLFQNFLNSSCFIYPVHFTCLNNFEWSLGNPAVLKMNEHYQLWSKAGLTPNFRVDNSQIYLQNFNWVSNWFNSYFFNKISDLLLGLIFLILILNFTFYNKIKLKLNTYHHDLIIYAFVVILFLEWFYNHPALRYGGYCLIVIILSYPFSIFFESYKNNPKEIKKKTLILLSISFLIFFSRNVNRINNEIVKYNYQPIKEPYFRISDNHFRFNEKFKILIDNYENCILGINCNQNLYKKIKKNNFGNYIFVKEND